MNARERGLTVAARMSHHPIVVAADAPLAAAVDLIERHGVSGLPVVDGSGALVGVVSQTDLARARATEYLWANWPGLSVRHLMTQPAVTIAASMPLAVAAGKMERLHIHRLVVVADDDPTAPIGVLSLSDIVHSITLETAPSAPQRAVGVGAGEATDA